MRCSRSAVWVWILGARWCFRIAGGWMELVRGNVKLVWVMESLLNIISCSFVTAVLVPNILAPLSPLPINLLPRAQRRIHFNLGRMVSPTKRWSFPYRKAHASLSPSPPPRSRRSEAYSHAIITLLLPLSNHAMFLVAVVAFLGVGIGTFGLPSTAVSPGDNCLLELAVLVVGG